MDRIKATESALIASGIMASGVLVAQLLTPADPIGKCWVFWKQLWTQVSAVSPVAALLVHIVLYCTVYLLCRLIFCGTYSLLNLLDTARQDIYLF